MEEDQSSGWRARKDQWYRYVEGVLRAVDAGRNLPLGPSSSPLVAPVVPASSKGLSKVLFCAPHPDDESLSGALPLRLRLETGAQVTNVAITLGADVEQRARRRRELESACRVLGFELLVPADPSARLGAAPSGFENINPANRRTRPDEWAAKVEGLCEIFDRQQPDVVFAPHAEDFNTTHIGTHFLVREALSSHLRRTGLGALPLIETEFWHQLSEPNLMVGVAPEVVALQLMAAAEHGGEMARNPYQLRHVCRLLDNVRRGSEVVGGQGVGAQTFAFAELYRLAFVSGAQDRELAAPRPGARIVGPAEKIDAAELLHQFLPEGL